MSRITAFVVEKGGAGKTTSAVHTAHAIARRKKRVLLIDLDPQCNATAWLTKPGAGEHRSDALVDVFDLVATSPAEIPAALGSVIMPSLLEGVDLIPGSRRIGTQGNVFRMGHDRMERDPNLVLKRIVRDIPPIYDFVFLDCPSSVTLQTTNAIIAADRLVITVDPSEMTWDGVIHLIETLKQAQSAEKISVLPPLSILRTMWDPRLRLSKRLGQNLTEFAPHMFSEAVPTRIYVRELPTQRKTSFDLDPNDVISQAYDAAARELIEISA